MSTMFNFWVLNLGSIGSLVNQGDLVETFLLPEELETDQGFESQPDFVMEPDASSDGSADPNPEALQENALAEIGSLPTIDSIPNLDGEINSSLPPLEPDVVEEPEAVEDPEPEPDVVEEPEAVEEQEPAPAEPDGVAGPEAETAASDTSSESNAGADPNPEAPDVAAELAPESTNSSSTSTTSTSTSGGSSSMVTTSSVNRAEVTQQASAVVSIAAGIELRAGGKQGRNTFRFTLTRSGDSTGESSVAWAVRGRGDNPAAAQDFRGQQLPRGTVTFAAGETSRTVSVRVRPTDREKGFALRLDKARGAVLGRSQARATIAPPNTLIGTGGDDRIQGSKRTEFIVGSGGQDLLTGGGGADVFGFRYGDSQVASPDRITDFSFGENRIAVRKGLPRRFSRATDNSSASSLEDLAAAVFADANGRRSGNQVLGRREAALVVSTNAEIAGTYLLINNGKAGLNPRNDLLIEVSGFSGDLPGLGRIDPGLVFG